MTKTAARFTVCADAAYSSTLAPGYAERPYGVWDHESGAVVGFVARRLTEAEAQEHAARLNAENAAGLADRTDEAPRNVQRYDPQREYANAIACQAEAIANGTVIGPRYAAALRLLANAQALLAMTPDDRDHTRRK